MLSAALRGRRQRRFAGRGGGGGIRTLAGPDRTRARRRRSGVGGRAGAREEPLASARKREECGVCVFVHVWGGVSLACVAGPTSGRVKIRPLHPSARVERRAPEPGEVPQVRPANPAAGMSEASTGRDESPPPWPPFEAEATRPPLPGCEGMAAPPPTPS